MEVGAGSSNEALPNRNAEARQARDRGGAPEGQRLSEGQGRTQRTPASRAFKRPKARTSAPSVPRAHEHERDEFSRQRCHEKVLRPSRAPSMEPSPSLTSTPDGKRKCWDFALRIITATHRQVRTRLSATIGPGGVWGAWGGLDPLIQLILCTARGRAAPSSRCGKACGEGLVWEQAAVCGAAWVEKG
jgi:hypothetical protein